MSFSSDAHLGNPKCASRIFQVRIQKNADVHLRKFIAYVLRAAWKFVYLQWRKRNNIKKQTVS